MPLGANLGASAHRDDVPRFFDFWIGYCNAAVRPVFLAGQATQQRVVLGKFRGFQCLRRVLPRAFGRVPHPQRWDRKRAALDGTCSLDFFDLRNTFLSGRDELLRAALDRVRRCLVRPCRFSTLRCRALVSRCGRISRSASGPQCSVRRLAVSGESEHQEPEDDCRRGGATTPVVGMCDTDVAASLRRGHDHHPIGSATHLGCGGVYSRGARCRSESCGRHECVPTLLLGAEGGDRVYADGAEGWGQAPDSGH